MLSKLNNYKMLTKCHTFKSVEGGEVFK